MTEPTPLDQAKSLFQSLGVYEKLKFLEFCLETEPHKYEYVTMPTSLRWFYTPLGKEEEFLGLGCVPPRRK